MSRVEPGNRTVRTAARAVIIRGNDLLVIRMRDQEGEFLLLPGGGQRHGETLEETVTRECREELGMEISVTRFLFFREYIGRNHTFQQIHQRFHQVEAIFRCSLEGMDEVAAVENFDRKQVGWEWVPFADLATRRFFPRVILPFFRQGDCRPDRVYLGDSN